MIPIMLHDGCDAETLTRQVLEGAIVILSDLHWAHELARHARELLEAAFAPLDPVQAQHELSVEVWSAIVAALKPQFIHSPRTAEIVRNLLVEDLSFDPEQCYADVARVRGVTSHHYLTAGVGHQQPPHRDTWWCSPPCQLNWWMPVYSMEPGSAMAFHPKYWRRPLANSSSTFNVYDWNLGGRAAAATQTGRTDARAIPEPLELVDSAGAIPIVLPPGSLVLFSGAHLHETLPNQTGRTRWSVDFRTLLRQDVIDRAGPPRLDNASVGTALRDFRRLSDRQRLSEQEIAPYDRGRDPRVPVVVYGPDGPEVLIAAVDDAVGAS